MRIFYLLAQGLLRLWQHRLPGGCHSGSHRNGTLLNHLQVMVPLVTVQSVNSSGTEPSGPAGQVSSTRPVRRLHPAYSISTWVQC